MLVSIVLRELQADTIQLARHVDDTHRNRLQARLDGRAVATMPVKDHQARQRRIHIDVLQDTEARDRLHELGADTQVGTNVGPGLQELRMHSPNRVRRNLRR